MDGAKERAVTGVPAITAAITSFGPAVITAALTKTILVRLGVLDGAVAGPSGP